MKRNSVEPSPTQRRMLRSIVIFVLGMCGVVANNWWIYIWFITPAQPTVTGMLSDLEVRGEPGAALMGGLDMTAGIAFLLALLLSHRIPQYRKARGWLIVYALSAILGGAFPYACAEGLDPQCRRQEWLFQLPFHHYIHVVSGIVSFAAVTIALVYLIAAVTQSRLPYVAIGFGYLLLVVSYLANRYGMLVEPLFMVSGAATVMWCLWLHQRQRPRRLRANA